MNQADKDVALLAEIQAMVDQDVKPLLQAHGGDITLCGIEEGVLRFRLKGACSGCPSSWLTAEELVRGPLLEKFPSLTDAVADTDMDEDMVALAKAVLAGHNPFE